MLFAARDGHIEAVSALVAHGADVDQVSGGDGSSPMVIAIANGHYSVAQFLLGQSADPNLVNIDGLGPLYATVNMRFAPVSWAPNPPTEQETVDSLDLLRALLEQGADPNARITIVEFGDYQCTFCYKFHKDTMNKIFEKQSQNLNR